jgi:HEAT repeat protein
VANRFFFVAEVPGGARGSDTLSLTEPFQVTFRRSDGAVLPGRDYRLEFPDGTRLTATSDLMGALRREDYVPGEVEVVDPYTGYVLDRFDPVRDLRPDDPGFVDGLMAAAAPGQPLWRRIHALNDLGNLRAQAAIPMLTALLDEPEQAIWYNAALSLGNMGTPQDAVVSAILAKLAIAVNEEELERAVDVLGALGDARAAPALRPLAMGVAGPVRAHALYALGRLPVSDEALATLIANLEGGAVFDPPWIRAEAALAVGRLGDRRAIPALIGVLNESWTVVRLRAAEALGRLVGEGDVDAVGPLRSLLVDTDHRVVLQAAVALERIEGEAARGALATAVQNPRVPKWAKAQVRRVAAGY